VQSEEWTKRLTPDSQLAPRVLVGACAVSCPALTLGARVPLCAVRFPLAPLTPHPSRLTPHASRLKPPARRDKRNATFRCREPENRVKELHRHDLTGDVAGDKRRSSRHGSGSCQLSAVSFQPCAESSGRVSRVEESRSRGSRVESPEPETAASHGSNRGLSVRAVLLSPTSLDAHIFACRRVATSAANALQW